MHEDMAKKLSEIAADKLTKSTFQQIGELPGGLASIDVKSMALGMKLARDGIKLTAEAGATALEIKGDEAGAKALKQLASELVNFPIIGE